MSAEHVSLCGRYTVVCRDFAGRLKWQDSFDNLVTDVGRNNILDFYLAGGTYAGWFIGLVDAAGTPSYAAGDTMASHAGWTEATGYVAATRGATSWNAAASQAKATNPVVFTMSGSATLAGALLCNDSTKGGTTGILYSVGAFDGGNRSVVATDVLNVTYTATA